ELIREWFRAARCRRAMGQSFMICWQDRKAALCVPLSEVVPRTILPGRGVAVQKPLARDVINPPAALDLFRLYLEPKLLLQRARDGAAYRMPLPLELLDDLVDRCAFRPLEHVDQLGLLAVGACAGFLLLRCRFALSRSFDT